MIDHVVLAVPNLADGVAEFRRLIGVDPVIGGSHTNLGTANYLVGLGGGAYLEIIGPDPDQPDPARPGLAPPTMPGPPRGARWRGVGLSDAPAGLRQPRRGRLRLQWLSRTFNAAVDTSGNVA
jgi:hypothetical protein